MDRRVPRVRGHSVRDKLETEAGFMSLGTRGRARWKSEALRADHTRDDARGHGRVV